MSRVKLGDVVKRIKDSVNKDTTDLEYYVGGEHFDYGSMTVSKYGLIKGSTIGPAFSTKFKKGDVLLMSRNPHLRKAGMVLFDGICSDVSYIIRTKDENVLLQNFIPIVFQSELFWKFAEKNKKGSTNFFLNWSDFERFEFELPSRDEQEKICELIWAINDSIEANEKMLVQSDMLIKAKFTECFGNLEINSKSFPVKPLSEIADYWNGLTYKPSDVTESSDGTLVLRSSNIQNGTLCFDDNVFVSCLIKDKLYVKNNDILMCSRNGSAKLVGKVALIEGLTKPTTFGAFMMIIRSNYYSFLKTFFELDAFRNQITTGTATINQITGNMLGKVNVPVPPLHMVESFSKEVTEIEKSKTLIREELNSLHLLFSKMTNKYIRED